MCPDAHAFVAPKFADCGATRGTSRNGNTPIRLLLTAALAGISARSARSWRSANEYGLSQRTVGLTPQNCLMKLRLPLPRLLDLMNGSGEAMGQTPAIFPFMRVILQEIRILQRFFGRMIR